MAGRKAYDGAGGLCPIYVLKKLQQRLTEGVTPQHISPDDIGGAIGRGGATKSLLQTGTNSLANSEKIRTTTDKGGNGLCGSQRGDQQVAVANKGGGVLDIPGYLATVGEKNGTTLGKVSECERGQTGTAGVPAIITSVQIVTVSISGVVHRSAHGGGSEAEVMKRHLAVVQTGDREADTTVEGRPGLDRVGEGRDLQL